MRNYLSILFAIILVQCAKNTPSYEQTIQAKRDTTDMEFRHVQNSILDKDALASFIGIPYFSIDRKYRVKATFRLIENGDTFRMATSTKRKPLYRAYGVLNFIIDQKGYHLTLFQDMGALKNNPSYDGLFCPFKDLTNGKETYGSGRYLDFKISELKAPIVDFNICYNPYCAYNHKYSCPIPPLENHLDIAIRAGVRM